jgi:hypothetical protein
MEPASKRARASPDAEADKVLFQSKKARLVGCAPYETLDLEPRKELCALDALLEPTSLDVRSVVWLVLTAPSPTWRGLKLGFPHLAAELGDVTVALVHKPLDRQLKAPGVQIRKLLSGSRSPLDVAEIIALSGTALRGTMRYEDLRSKLQQLEPREVLAQYAHLSSADFRALLIKLKVRVEAKEELTDEEQLLVRYACDFEKLRRDVVDEQQAKLMLHDAREEPLVYPKDFDFAGLRAWRVNVLSGERVEEPVVKAIWAAVADRKAVVFYGLAGCGKTPMARALAAFLARAKKSNSFVVTQTVDSLRKLDVKDHTPVVFDEFAPRQQACGAQGGGVDALKCVLDSTETKVLQARYSDFALPGSCPRIVTTQGLDKIDGALLEAAVASPEHVLGLGSDALAILKRVQFVEFAASAIPPEAVERHRASQRTDWEDAIAAELAQQ